MLHMSWRPQISSCSTILGADSSALIRLVSRVSCLMSRVRARSCSITLPLRNHRHLHLPLPSKSMRVFPKLKPRSKLKTEVSFPSPSAKFLGLKSMTATLFFVMLYFVLFAGHTHTHTPLYTHTLATCFVVVAACSASLALPSLPLSRYISATVALTAVYPTCPAPSPFPLPPSSCPPFFGAQFDVWSILISFFFCVCQLTVKTNDTEK